jgi:cytochrome c oxidase assembly factor CtaG
MGAILLSLFIALLFTLVFTVLFGRRGPWASVAIFFLVLFLATLGIGRYIRYMGPAAFGIYWLPFLLIGLLFSLLLAAALPAGRVETREERRRAGKEEGQSRVALDSFFWFLIVALVLLIVMSYAFPGIVI